MLASIYSSANNSAFNSPAGMLGHQQLPSLSPQPPHLGLGLNSGYNSNSNGFTPSNSPSPPLSSAGIRLPNAPLSDIAEYRSNSGNINGEYNSGEYIEYNEYDRNSNEPELGYPESYDSPYLNNYNRLPTSVSPSPHPRTPHSLPLPLSSTNSPYSGSSHLGSPHLGSPHLGSPGNMVPSPLAEAQLLQSQASAGSSSNGSTSTLMDIYSSPETLVNPDSANTKISPMLMPPSLSRELTVPVGSGQRNKSHTISTSTPYEAYLNASREARGQERMLYGTPRERSGSVSSVYSTHSASSASSAHSSRASSILLSAHSVHASLPEIEGEDTVLVSVSGSMDELHMGLGGLHEMHETLDPSVLNGERV
ncbi:MAG: hypothetical protein NXY57DRAFT_963687 [Lentinula lateritia]|nr:MAG: hypothetical protein NXY57DRAFT_963687 [Lentinula lateritia]